MTPVPARTTRPRTTPLRAAADRFRRFVARRAFTPRERTGPPRIGAEVEFLAVITDSRQVAPLDGVPTRSLLSAVRAAAHQHGWREGGTGKGAPAFTLPRGGRITFEPGGQVEYAAPPRASITELVDDLARTSASLRDAAAALGITLLECGLDPFNGPDGAPLQVRAPRYRRMDAHFAGIGPAGARMMRQTASLQVGIDIGDDAPARWRLLNALSPVFVALFANSRTYAGHDTGFASYRAETWRRTDPARTGVLHAIDPIGEYVDFALRAPAILLGDNTEMARPFHYWAAATDLADWEQHLGTLFPEVRPRGYFEVRSMDAVPQTHWPAALAFVAGLAYDRRSSLEAAEVAGCPDPGLLERAGRQGLADPALGSIARELVAIALAGCERLPRSVIAERHLRDASEVLGALTR